MKVIYKFGEMNSGKTMDLLTNDYVFNDKGLSTYLVKPEVDTRQSGMKSRVGLSKEVNLVIPTKNPKDCLSEIFKALDNNDIVLFDESQFIDKDIIYAIGKHAHLSNLPTIIFFYGLLKDFNNKLFPGSQALLEIADSIVPVHKICEFKKCTHKATCNYLKNNKKNGNIVIGDSAYISVCQKHYYKLKEND